MERVVAALADIYGSVPSQADHQLVAERRRVAQLQLSQFQDTPEAWPLAFDLLAHSETAVQFFGAQTLQAKISRDFQSLDIDSQLELRSRLLAQLFTPGRNVAVVRKLAAAVSVLILKSSADDLWPDALPSLIAHASVSQVDIHAVLEVLTILPEETAQSTEAATIVARVNTAIMRHLDLVLSFIDRCMSNEFDIVSVSKSARCLQSWIQFEMPSTALPLLINKSISLLPDSAAFEAALEVLNELILHPHVSGFGNAFCDSLLPQLTEGFLMARFNEANTDGDEDTMSAICGLAINLGEQFTTYIIENVHRSAVANLLQIILRCTDVSGYYAVDEEISEMTLNFWFILQDTVQDSSLSIESLTGSNVDTSPQLSLIHQVYEQLVSILWRKSMLPSDAVLETWSLESKSKFQTYRREIADTILYCHYLLGDKCLTIIRDIIKSQVHANSAEGIEAGIQALRSISENLQSSNSEIVKECICAAQEIGKVGTPRVLKATLMLYGSYALWLSKQDSGLVQSVFELILTNMNSENTTVTQSAFQTFSKLCDGCRSMLAPLMDSFLQMYFSMFEQSKKVGSLRASLLSGISCIIQALPVVQQIRPIHSLVFSVSARLRYVLDNQDIDPQQRQLDVVKLFDDLICTVRSMQLRDEEPQTGTFIVVAAEEKRLFFKNFGEIIAMVWPIIVSAGDNFFDDNVLLQLSSLLDTLILSFKSSVGFPSVYEPASANNVFIDHSLSQNFCAEFGKLMARLSQKQLRIPLYDGMRSLVSVFGPFAELSSMYSEPEFARTFPDLASHHWQLVSYLSNSLALNGIAIMKVSMSQLSFNGGDINDDAALNEQSRILSLEPDVSQAFFMLIANCIEKHPRVLFQHDAMELIQGVGFMICGGLLVKEEPTCAAIFQLLNSILLVSSICEGKIYEKIAYDMLKWMAPMLFHKLVEGIAGHFAKSSLRNVGELLFNLSMKFPGDARNLTRLALGLPLPDKDSGLNVLKERWTSSVSCGLKERESFCLAVTSSRQLRKTRVAVDEFANICRASLH